MHRTTGGIGYLSLRVVEDVVHGFQAHHVAVDLQRYLGTEVGFRRIDAHLAIVIQHAIHRPNLLSKTNEYVR